MLKIITDSASDMPQHIVERFNLHVIPTPVVIDGVDYLDGATIHTKEFYEILDDVSRDIKTYHINPSMFEEAFRPYAEHNDSVIYLCFSTGIAGTFNAANIAKQNILEDYPDFDLTIVDSKSAAIGFGLIVYKLLLLQEAGADKEKLLRAANFYVNHIQHVFTVSTLRYLIKGGRLSKWKGTAGELLDMKPVLIVDKDGSLQVLKTIRGRKKSLKALIEYAQENILDKYDYKKVSGIITGGAERYDSVYKALCSMPEEGYVLIHDGARAFITSELIEFCIDQVKKDKSCVMGMPVKDTIKIVDENRYAVSTPPRSTMWQIQTPQCFVTAEIREAYQKMMEAGDDSVTDDGMVMETYGIRGVRMIKGSYENMKITTPEDMLLGEAILKGRSTER